MSSQPDERPGIEEVTDEEAARRERKERAWVLLKQEVVASKRREQVGMFPGFLTSVDGNPPLSRLIARGRGEVALRLYLTIVLRATRAPHKIENNRLPQKWAEMLALPQPATAGRRRIKDALSLLQSEKLIKLTPRAAQPPVIQLLSVDGRGRAYLRPGSGEAHKAGDVGGYLGIPLDLWRQGWLLDLSIPELAILLILLSEQRQSTDPFFIWPDRKPYYGLSDDTWTRGARDLRDHGLITLKRVYDGDDQHSDRRRNSYLVEKTGLALPAPSFSPTEE